jgi:phage tail-like protein
MNFLAPDTTPYWLLDSVIGWQGDKASQQSLIVEYGAEGDLRLQSLPGTAQLLLNGSPGGMECPAACGVDECERLFVLDAARNRLWRVRTDTGEAKHVREIGGKGGDARRFDTPRGFALLPGGGVAVCDTNNHRVQVFSGPPYALVQLWGADENQPGRGPLEFHYPWGVAYGPDGFLYIADRGNGRIQRVKPDGSQWSEIGVGAHASPTQIAVSPQGYVAVCDAAAPTQVTVFLPGTWTAQFLTAAMDSRLARQEACPAPSASASAAANVSFLSVAFDPSGDLYAGTSKGLVFEWTPGTNCFSSAGAGVSGLDSAITALAWLGNGNLIASIDEQDVTPLQRLWTIPTAGAFVSCGCYACVPLDSRIENCVWHRIQVEGTVPAATSLRIETFTSPDPTATSAPWQTALLSPPSIPTAQVQALLGQPTAAQTPSGAYKDPDGLVQSGPGRFLWLRITMISNGTASPEMHAIKIYFPRQSYLQYLPANFQDDDQSRNFLDRFLPVFQTSFDAFDRRIDNLWRLFDPLSTPEGWYNWLAAWIALPIDPDWTWAKKRQMLDGAPAQYQLRGTVTGLQQAILDYAGVQGNILEHFKLRRWPMILSPAAQRSSTAGSMNQYDARLCAATPLWSRAFAARLQVGKYSAIGSFELTGSGSPAADPFTWGASQFTVFFAADPYNPQTTATKVQQAVEREKPAHTKAYYVPVYPRMRVGVQASVGVDSYLSRITYAVLNRVGTLGYDAVLGESPAQKQVAELGSSVPPITGLNTRLL